MVQTVFRRRSIYWHGIKCT